MKITDILKRHQWRLLTLLELGLFCLSVSLLLWASTAPERIPGGQVTWPGVIDVLSAIAVAILGILIYAKAHKLVDASIWQIYYLLATTLPASLFLALWIFAARIRWWDVLVLGLAWRVYVLLQTLPAVITIWKNKPA